MGDTVLIDATRVPEKARITFLPRHLGRLALEFEGRVFSTMGTLCDAYEGGYWEFYNLTNGGFYMAPHDQEPLFLQVEGNGFSGRLSADASGIVATLFALNGLSWRHTDNETIPDMYYALRSYACSHPEATKILEAID